MWSEFEGTKTCEISTLQGNGKTSGSLVTLPDGGQFDLSKAQKDRHGEEIAGWRFEHNGQKYLVIND